MYWLVGATKWQVKMEPTLVQPIYNCPIEGHSAHGQNICCPVHSSPPVMSHDTECTWTSTAAPPSIDKPTLSASTIETLGSKVYDFMRQQAGWISLGDTQPIVDASTLLLSDSLPLIDCIREPTVRLVSAFLMTLGPVASATGRIDIRKFVVRFVDESAMQDFAQHYPGINCVHSVDACSVMDEKYQVSPIPGLCPSP